jgi:mycothiol system anti-sigma-R factor
LKQTCKEYLQQAYLFLDGEILSETERHEMSIHLEECSPCLERYGLEEELVMVISRLRHANPCPDRLKTRIAGLLEEA